jgi:hypothetical protein
MGSYASLCIDDLELFTVKNVTGFWGQYFTREDKKTAIYTYFDEDGKVVKVRRPALVKKLKELLKHFELIGIPKKNSDPEFFNKRMNLVDEKVCK